MTLRRLLRGVAALSLLAGAIAHVRAEDWPEWRGAGRAGVWNETGIVDTLPATLRVAWRVPVNKGYSGPAVANGRIFVTDARRATGDKMIELQLDGRHMGERSRRDSDRGR
jgi:hypothetical protein